MPGVVSADLFERVIPVLPLLSMFQRQKRVQSNSYLEKLSQNILIVTMVFVMFLFANDVFDVGFYVVCYENTTHVTKKDVNICVESMKPSIEAQAPEFLTLIIGILLGVMFLINRIWEFFFQCCIRQHVEEVIDELNDSLYRAMMVTISRNNAARQCTGVNGIYNKPLTLHIEDIAPLSSCKYCWIPFCFILKNGAYCGVAVALIMILLSMFSSYKNEYQQCEIENRNLNCTIPEYQTLKWIQRIGCVSSGISCLIIILIFCLAFCCVNTGYKSFLKVYNRNIIPNYNYDSLTLQSPDKAHCCCLKHPAWGVILLYLEENGSLLRHYRYLKSMCSIPEIIDSSETSPLLPNEIGLKLLKRMKQQVLVDMFEKDWPQSQAEPDSTQRHRSD